MSERRRRYTIQPGVPMPNIDEILEATSDYSITGVDDLAIRTFDISDKKNTTRTNTTVASDNSELQQLGKELAKSEEESREYSQNMMNDIKKRAVIEPASIDSLKKVASSRVIDDKRREEIDSEMKIREEERLKKEKIAQARANRRMNQKKAVERIKFHSEDIKESDSSDFDNVSILSNEDTANNFKDYL